MNRPHPGGGLFVPALDHARAANYHRGRGLCEGLAMLGVLLLACAWICWPKSVDVQIWRLGGGGGGGGLEKPPVPDAPKETQPPAVSTLPN